MSYIPKRVLYDEFPEEGVYGVTARQALEAAIDNLLPAYHLIFSPVTLYEYTPMQIKLAVTGNGHADKKQVQQMVKILLSLKAIPKPDDAADALAAAICHANTNRFATAQFRIK